MTWSGSGSIEGCAKMYGEDETKAIARESSHGERYKALEDVLKKILLKGYGGGALLVSCRKSAPGDLWVLWKAFECLSVPGFRGCTSAPSLCHLRSFL